KKEEIEDDDDDDATLASAFVNGEKKSEKKKKKAEPTSRKRKEKVVYDLPGQKRQPPEERDPLRIFYESLYEQSPESEMAAIWMMESGLLPLEKAKEVLERKQKKGGKRQLITTSPIKSATAAAKTKTK
ncbi:hypothetical protein M569_10528, partial [Genlisea aurea]